MFIKNTIDLNKVKAWMLGVGQESIHKGAEYLAQQMRGYAPVDTGFLQGSIQVHMAPGESIVNVYVVAYYAEFVEFGHVAMNGTYISPNPFMRHAMADLRQIFPTIVNQATALVPYGRDVTEVGGMQANDHLFMGVTFTN